MSKVICPNCGSEVVLPETSELVIGMTVSEEGNDVHYLPMKERKSMTKAEERIQTLKAMGVDTSRYFIAKNTAGQEKLFSVNDGKIEDISLEDEILSGIYANGYVRNTQLHRRWVMAQTFHALAYRCPYDRTKKGFDAWLRDHGYSYQWKMMSNEYHDISKMEGVDEEAFKKRTMFFDKNVVVDSLIDYQGKLKNFVEALPNKKFKGKPYKRIRRRIGDVLLTDLDAKVYSRVDAAIEDVSNAQSYREISRALDNFVSRDYIKLPMYTPMSKEFIDAYKGSGAYFTCDNLIKFHGCKVVGAEDSLKILNQKAKKYSEDKENWRLFGFMKKLIKDNNFNFDARMAELYD